MCMSYSVNSSCSLVPVLHCRAGCYLFAGKLEAQSQREEEEHWQQQAQKVNQTLWHALSSIVQSGDSGKFLRVVFIMS
jgi:hypothetical protein